MADTDTDDALDPTKRKPLEDNLGMGPVRVASPMGAPSLVPPISRPVSATGVPMYGQGDAVPATGTAPPINPHVAEAQRMEQSGSGVSQVQANHPFWGGVLRGLDVASTIAAPGIAAAIPGTTAHHNALIGQQEGLANQDIAQQEKQAQTQEIQQKPQMEQAVLQHQDDLEAQKEAARQAQQAAAQKEQQDRLDQTQGQQQDIADQREEVADANRQTSEANADRRFTLQEKNADRRAAQAGNIGTWALHDDGAGHVVEYNSKTGEVRPAPAGITPKVTADEQRRSDLSQNMNENLDALEDIVKRRPELFGTVNGTMTHLRQKFGTDDPDVARLQTLDDFLGKASLGAHAMRNGALVEKSAAALTGAYRNSPQAIESQIQAARNSLKTFTQQKAPASQGVNTQQSGPPAGAVGIAPGSDGKNHYHDAQGKDLGVAP